MYTTFIWLGSFPDEFLIQAVIIACLLLNFLGACLLWDMAIYIDWCDDSSYPGQKQWMEAIDGSKEGTMFASERR